MTATNIQHLALTVSERGGNAAEAFEVTDVSDLARNGWAPVVGYIARANRSPYWSVHNDAGHYLGERETLTAALSLLV